MKVLDNNHYRNKNRHASKACPHSITSASTAIKAMTSIRTDTLSSTQTDECLALLAHRARRPAIVQHHQDEANSGTRYAVASQSPRNKFYAYKRPDTCEAWLLASPVCRGTCNSDRLLSPTKLRCPCTKVPWASPLSADRSSPSRSLVGLVSEEDDIPLLNPSCSCRNTLCLLGC